MGENVSLCLYEKWFWVVGYRVIVRDFYEKSYQISSDQILFRYCKNVIFMNFHFHCNNKKNSFCVWQKSKRETWRSIVLISAGESFDLHWFLNTLLFYFVFRKICFTLKISMNHDCQPTNLILAKRFLCLANSYKLISFCPMKLKICSSLSNTWLNAKIWTNKSGM